ncbi:MAG: hypothetical protein ABFS14_03230 [Gemmatimonadota bacterium]
MIKSCLSRIGCLTVLVLAAGGAWYFQDDLKDVWNRALTRLEITAPAEPSESAAQSAEKKLLRLGNGSTSVRLTEVELQSLLTYRLAPMLPPGVSDSQLEIRDSTVVISSLLQPAELSDLADGDVLSRVLGDSTRVTTELKPGVFTAGVARLEVEALQAGALAIPSPMIPFVLGSLRIAGVETSARALLVPAPSELRQILVRDGAIELSTIRAAEADQAGE